MEKVLQIVIAATVLLMAASIVMFMVSDQSKDFSDIIESQTGSAQCKLWQKKYESNVCDGDASSDAELEEKFSSSDTCSAPC